MRRNHSTPLVILVLLVFCLTTYAYAPIFFHYFGFHNDYRLWERSSADGFFSFLETRHLFGIGRPLLAILLNLHLMFIHNMHTLHMAQVCSVISIAITATAFFLHTQKTLNISLAGAALLAVLTFTLPSMAISAFWVTNYVSGIVALWVAFAAFLLIQYQPTKLFYAIAAGLLLYIDFLIYPPSTFFFITLTALLVLFGPKKTAAYSLKTVWSAIIIMLITAALYFISITFIFKPYFLSHPDFLYEYLKGHDWQTYYKAIETQFPQYTLQSAFDFSGKLRQLREYIILVISAWFPPLRIRWTFVVLLACLGVIIHAAFTSPYIKLRRTHAQALKIFCLFILLSLFTALPLLLSPSVYTVNYRIAFASMAIMPALLVFATERGVIFFKRYGTFSCLQYAILAFCALLVLFAETAASQRLFLVVERATNEYRWVQNHLNHKLTAATTTIHVHLPITDYANRHYLHADFGLNASDIGIQGLVQAALQELGKNPAQYHILFDKNSHDSTQPVTIDPILTTIRKITPERLTGQWLINGKKIFIKESDAKLIVTNELNEPYQATLSDDQLRLTIPEWNNMYAMLSEDGKTLYWEDGKQWFKR